jgi:hypothetical protein
MVQKQARRESSTHTQATTSYATSLPAVMQNSPLLKQGGFAIFEGVLDVRGVERMLDEALQFLPSAQPNERAESDNMEGRGGNPARKFLSIQGGPLQDTLYSAGWMIDFLQRVTGAPVLPTGARGTYSYYIRRGDFLALHRDIITCDLAVITCLQDQASSLAPGGRLTVYPARLFEPLSAIRATPDDGVIGLRLEEGQTIVMYGGILPHAVSPMLDGQKRIVSVLCYEVHA